MREIGRLLVKALNFLGCQCLQWARDVFYALVGIKFLLMCFGRWYSVGRDRQYRDTEWSKPGGKMVDFLLPLDSKEF